MDKKKFYGLIFGNDEEPWLGLESFKTLEEAEYHLSRMILANRKEWKIVSREVSNWELEKTFN